jgi:hypothetical protein
MPSAAVKSHLMNGWGPPVPPVPTTDVGLGISRILRFSSRRNRNRSTRQLKTRR